jgi:hypothetical protein
MHASTMVLMGLLALLSTGVRAQDLVAEPAPEWSALFHRQQGWTGADGIFFVPLNGNEVRQ